MKLNDPTEYFRPKSYPGYLIFKTVRGDIGKAFGNIYKKIRKYTLISGIIKAFTIVITLLEKSAFLLLIATALVLIFPLILFLTAIYAMLCISKYIRMRRQVRDWLLAGEKITVFITKERVFSNGPDPLFLRMAKSEAAHSTHPVIVVCTDRFVAAKWYSLNLLTVKTDYFFVLKRHYLGKLGKKLTFIVL